jgi:hypothetical protein
MKNKYNIPVVVDDTYLKEGNFIDHITYIKDKNIIFKRRNISKIDWLILYGISLEIRKKPGN